MYENAVLPAVADTHIGRPRLYCCKSKRYANYMLAHGSRMAKIQHDKVKPGYLVFLFYWDDVCDQNAKEWENGARETYIV